MTPPATNTMSAAPILVAVSGPRLVSGSSRSTSTLPAPSCVQCCVNVSTYRSRLCRGLFSTAVGISSTAGDGFLANVNVCASIFAVSTGHAAAPSGGVRVL